MSAYSMDYHPDDPRSKGIPHPDAPRTPAPDANETERAMAPMRYVLDHARGFMTPDKQYGEWVKDHDFDALCAKVRELQGELTEAESNADSWHTCLESMTEHRNRLIAERDAAQGEAKRLRMLAADGAATLGAILGTGLIPACAILLDMQRTFDRINAALTAQQPAKGE